MEGNKRVWKSCHLNLQMTPKDTTKARPPISQRISLQFHIKTFERKIYNYRRLIPVLDYKQKFSSPHAQAGPRSKAEIDTVMMKLLTFFWEKVLSQFLNRFGKCKERKRWNNEQWIISYKVLNLSTYVFIFRLYF